MAVGDAFNRTRCWVLVNLSVLVAVVLELPLLAGLHAPNRVAGLTPCLVPVGVVAGGWLTQRPGGVVDLEPLPVVLHEPRAVPQHRRPRTDSGTGPSVSVR